MNYLAHIYLSGNNDDFKIGNFIGDFVKGNPNEQFSDDIAFGVFLHRKIDRFTDTHTLVRKSRSFFFSEFSHYSGVITDVLFDYFLAHHWSSYHQQNLTSFVEDFYKILKSKLSELPLAVQKIFPIMVRHNWLNNYQNLDGIQHILYQMNKRTAAKPGLENSIITLKHNYTDLKKYFVDFFEELRTYTQTLIEAYQQKKLHL